VVVVGVDAVATQVVADRLGLLLARAVDERRGRLPVPALFERRDLCTKGVGLRWCGEG